MKVAFSLPQSLDSPSGLGRHGPLARELARQGHSVEIYALHYDWGRLSQRVYFDSRVRVAYVGQMHVRKSGARKHYFSPGRLLMHSVISTLRLARAIYQSQAQILQLCKPQPINALATRLGRRGRPIVCDCDDYEAESNRFSGEWQRRVVRYFEDGIVGYAEGLTVNTRFSQNRYQNLGFPKQRIVYVPNGVDRARFTNHHDPTALAQRWGLDASDPTIAYVGTLSTLSHSVDLLLEAFAYLLRDLPRARLLLVGGGEDYDSLRDQAKTLGIDGRTLFVGRVSPEDVPAWLAFAEQYRLSSVAFTDWLEQPELVSRAARADVCLGSFGITPQSLMTVQNKIYEGMAMAKAVITGDSPAVREVLQDGEHVYLCERANPQALAEAITSLRDNPALRGHLARNGYRMFEESFNLAHTGRRLVAHLQEALAR